MSCASTALPNLGSLAFSTGGSRRPAAADTVSGAADQHLLCRVGLPGLAYHHVQGCCVAVSGFVLPRSCTCIPGNYFASAVKEGDTLFCLARPVLPSLPLLLLLLLGSTCCAVTPFACTVGSGWE